MKTFNDFLKEKTDISEAYVNTDAVDTENFVSMCRGALADESSACNLYTKILETVKDKEDAEVIEEILNDEKQHSVLLMKLIKKNDPNFKEMEDKASEEFPDLGK